LQLAAYTVTTTSEQSIKQWHNKIKPVGSIGRQGTETKRESMMNNPIAWQPITQEEVSSGEMTPQAKLNK